DLEHLAPKRSGIAWLCRGFCKRPCRAGRGHLAFLRSWLLSAWDAVLTAAWSMDDEGSDDTRPISATARSSSRHRGAWVGLASVAVLLGLGAMAWPGVKRPASPQQPSASASASA